MSRCKVLYKISWILKFKYYNHVENPNCVLIKFDFLTSVIPQSGVCSLWGYSGIKSASELDYAAEEGSGLRGNSVRLTFCRAFRGGGENFSGDSSTGIKIVSPSGRLSNYRP